MKFLKQLYINNLFFVVILLIITLFTCSFFFEFLYNFAWNLFYLLVIFVFIDILLLFGNKTGIVAQRKTAEKLSNGDENPIDVTIQNNYSFAIKTKVIDEIPFQFQIRNFNIVKNINNKSIIQFIYYLRPTERGEYNFGKLNIYAISPLGLIAKRYTFAENKMVPTYPSYMQLKKYDLLAISNNLVQIGLKKIRKIGHSLEFEQIKEYNTGDDIRSLNWKATAKKNALMVNQFQTEKSQNIYMIIDKGRVMKMPFNGLSLLDYSINASLVLSNIILKKDDKAGLFTFSKKIENRVVAEKRKSQMHKILETLYNIKTNYFESDFSRLYVDIKKNITHRSLILLYTNFETLDGMQRQLSYLKAIAKNHLLVVVFFQNTELQEVIDKKSKNLQEVYDKVIAEKFMYEKKQIVVELKKYGIYSILTKPEDLILKSINKYLEIKQRGII
jgi:uncharacterized protein (DUF58 family)